MADVGHGRRCVGGENRGREVECRKWEMGSGKCGWEVGGQLAVARGKRLARGGRYEVTGGRKEARWEVGCGRREIKGGRWEVKVEGSGRCEVVVDSEDRKWELEIEGGWWEMGSGSGKRELEMGGGRWEVKVGVGKWRLESGGGRWDVVVGGEGRS